MMLVVVVVVVALALAIESTPTAQQQAQAQALLSLFDSCVWPSRSWTRGALTDGGNASAYCTQFEGIACDSASLLVTSLSLRGVNALGTVPPGLLAALNASLQALDLQGNANLRFNLTAALLPCANGACGTALALLDVSGGVQLTLDVDAVDVAAALPALATLVAGPARDVVARNTTAFLNALFRLPQLVKLSLRGLPNLGGNSELDTTYLCSATQLHTLRLSRVALAGFAPPLACWAQMQQLRLLDLSGNRLGVDASGAVQKTPSALLCQGTPLHVVDLSANAFAMPMCTNFSGSQLREYSVAANNLAGPLPLAVDAPQLVALDFSFNNLSTALPPSLLASLPATLARLGLTGNSLTGVLRPSDLRSAAELGQPLALLDLTENLLQSDAVLSDVVNAGVVIVRNSSSTLAGTPGVVCFQLLLANGGLLNVDANLYDFAQCQCADGFVGRAPQCQRCPPLALDCHDKQIQIAAGTYPVLVAQPNMVGNSTPPCLVATIGVQSCGDHSDACRGGVVEIVTGNAFDESVICVEPNSFCAPGYVGRVCATCDCAADGNSTCYYGGRDSVCHACQPAAVTATIAALAIALLLGLGAFGASLHTLRVRAFGGPLFVVTALFVHYFVGITALISAVWLVLLAVCLAIGRHTSGDALMRVATFWMFATAALAPHMSTQMLQLFHADGLVPLVECVWPTLSSPMPRLIVQALTPVLLCALLLTALLGRFCGRGGGRGGGNELRKAAARSVVNDNDNDDSDAESGADRPLSAASADEIRLYRSNRDGVPTPVVAAIHARRIGGAFETTLSTVLYLVQLVHFDVCFTALSVFQCEAEPVSGAFYVQSWPSMECNTGDHSRLMLVGAVVAFVWGVGMPIAVAALLHYYPQHAALEQLWAPYAPSQQQYVGVFLLVRNFAFAAAITVTQGALRVATVNALALISSAVHQRISMPNAEIEHGIEVVVLLLVALSTALTESGGGDGSDDGSLASAPLTIAIVNGIFAVSLLLYALLRSLLTRHWHSLRKRFC